MIPAPNPRPFRVHTPNGPQDCWLHPDGTLTMTAAGQLWRSAFTYDEMLELDWSDRRIEWDPADHGTPPPQQPHPNQQLTLG